MASYAPVAAADSSVHRDRQQSDRSRAGAAHRSRARDRAARAGAIAVPQPELVAAAARGTSANFAGRGGSRSDAATAPRPARCGSRPGVGMGRVVCRARHGRSAARCARGSRRAVPVHRAGFVAPHAQRGRRPARRLPHDARRTGPVGRPFRRRGARAPGVSRPRAPPAHPRFPGDPRRRDRGTRHARRRPGGPRAPLGGPGLLLLRRALHDPNPIAADMARQTLDLPHTVYGRITS